MSFDIVAVGGATVDLFLLIDPQNPHVKFNSDSNELLIHLGDKVVLENSKLTVGGNANNVAVGLKRFGINSSLMAEIGNDEFADGIIDNLEKEGIDKSLIEKGRSPSSFSVILNFNNDRTIFTRKTEKEHNFNFSGLKTEWIYLTSLGTKWEEVYRKVGDYVRKEGVRLAFNPGPSQLDRGIDSFSYLLPLTEVLIVNKDEGEEIIGKKELSIKDLLFELKKLGPRIVVVTDGLNGSFSIDEKANIVSQDAIKVKEISATGAGDAYSSGFLAGLMHNKNIKEAMFWGTKNAASVVKLIGAQTGLLRREEI